MDTSKMVEDLNRPLFPRQWESSVHQFQLADLPTMPWKNGGGSTTELWCEPPGAGLDDFVWRVSVARIASDGPFSVFPGVDRVIVLLQGEGVRLQTSQGQHLVDLNHALQPFSFAGEWPIVATRLGGNSLDLNVMARRGQARANVQVLRPSAATEPLVPQAASKAHEVMGQHGLLLCVPQTPATQLTMGADGSAWQGRWNCGDENPANHQQVTLLPGQGLYWTHSPTPRYQGDAMSMPRWHWQPAVGSSSALLAVCLELENPSLP